MPPSNRGHCLFNLVQLGSRPPSNWGHGLFDLVWLESRPPKLCRVPVSGQQQLPGSHRVSCSAAAVDLMQKPSRTCLICCSPAQQLSCSLPGRSPGGNLPRACAQTPAVAACSASSWQWTCWCSWAGRASTPMPPLTTACRRQLQTTEVNKTLRACRMLPPSKVTLEISFQYYLEPLPAGKMSSKTQLHTSVWDCMQAQGHMKAFKLQLAYSGFQPGHHSNVQMAVTQAADHIKQQSGCHEWPT